VAIRQRQRRLTPDQLELAIDRYKAGATVYELAAEFGCHRATIAERLKLAGVTMRHQPTTTEQVDEIARLYESGLSMVKVAEQVGVSPRTVFNYLQERGVSTRDVHGRRKPLPGP
jgi:DNA-binding NarL/FixJ family response regulator